MWHKGYMHYHTSFHYPIEQRITPEELAEDLKKLEASFAFCAGDHGDIEGNNYWGWDGEFEEYKELCLSNSKDGNFIFIPSLEIHLKVPPFNERHEHHSCIPTLDYLPALKPAEEKALAISYTKEIDNFISQAHKHNLSLTLNHPYHSVNSFFGGPPPLTIPSLYQLDYLELFTLGSLGDDFDYFSHDFDLYLKFLSHSVSSMMGCCASIDNAASSCKLLSDKTGIIPSTYLYIHGKLTKEALMQAWNERRSYAVYGNLYLEEIKPIPSKKTIEITKRPTIDLSVRSPAMKEITKVEIFRNGRKVYEDKNNKKHKYSLSWEDKNPLKKENHYIIHIEGEEAHLITSPINYSLVNL